MKRFFNNEDVLKIKYIKQLKKQILIYDMISWENFHFRETQVICDQNNVQETNNTNNNTVPYKNIFKAHK